MAGMVWKGDSEQRILSGKKPLESAETVLLKFAFHRGE
jgi:hypothetical protein